VALEPALSNLCTSLQTLHGVLDGLRFTVTEDTPESGGVVLVDQVSEEVTELLGLTEECLDAAVESQRAAGQPYDPNQMRRFLVVSQKQFHRVSQILFSKLLAYEPIASLVQFARQRGREWMAWVDTLRHGLDKCRPVLEGVEEAYFQCWQEIGERVVAGPVSLNTTNIGQQITADALRSREAARQGAT
jgi:hypothetical protein